MICTLRKSRGQLVFEAGDGQLLARLRKSRWSEKATGTVLGRPWTFAASDEARTAHDDTVPSVVFTAWRPSVWRQGWALTCGPAQYEIRPRAVLSNAYDVFRNGAIVGESLRAGTWSNYPHLNVRDDVPAEEAVFLLWISFLMRARAAKDAASKTT